MALFAEDFFNSIFGTIGLTFRKPLYLSGNTNGTGVSISSGVGAPTFVAPANSLYLRIDGSSTTTRMYVNTTGSTTWATVTTSA